MIAWYSHCVTFSSFDLVDRGLWLGLLKQLHLIISFCLRALCNAHALQNIVPHSQQNSRNNSNDQAIDLKA